jgi:UDPglucose 6-dehydrogenase
MSVNIAVVGTGYVGLTTGTCLAHLGNDVTCIDVDAAKVERLTRAEIPIFEPGLSELVAEGLSRGALRFTTDAVAAVAGRDVVLLCVPTPMSSDGSADLTYVDTAVNGIRRHLEPGAILVNKSTAPVGTVRQIEAIVDREDVRVVSNPEFLREGSAVHDFLNPERVVIGADDGEAANRIAYLHHRLAAPVVLTDPESAELSKYAANSFLATKLTFVNEMAAVADAVGADIDDVLLVLGLDHRVGSAFLSPGPGWGGSCLPKDTNALLTVAAAAGHDSSFLQAVWDANQRQMDRVTAALVDAAGPGGRVAALGLTFKAGTDDLRDSPAIDVLRRVVAAGLEVRAFDPMVPAGAQVLDGVEVAEDAYAAAKGADVLVLLTEWPEFAELDFGVLADVMVQRQVVDTRNVLTPATVTHLGFTYRGTGRR